MPGSGSCMRLSLNDVMKGVESMGKSARKKRERRKGRGCQDAFMERVRELWPGEVIELSGEGDVLLETLGPGGRPAAVMMSAGFADRLLSNEGE